MEGGSDGVKVVEEVVDDEGKEGAVAVAVLLPLPLSPLLPFDWSKSEPLHSALCLVSLVIMRATGVPLSTAAAMARSAHRILSLNAPIKRNKMQQNTINIIKYNKINQN